MGALRVTDGSGQTGDGRVLVSAKAREAGDDAYCLGICMGSRPKTRKCRRRMPVKGVVSGCLPQAVCSSDVLTAICAPGPSSGDLSAYWVSICS